MNCDNEPMLVSERSDNLVGNQKESMATPSREINSRGLRREAGNRELLDSWISGQTSSGIEMHGTLLRLTRHVVTFEVYNPGIVLRVSEVLNELRIVAEGRTLYLGRAVLRHLIDTGPVLVCEATLEESWLDLEPLPPENLKNRLRQDFSKFMITSRKSFVVMPEFKVAVADLQVLLMDLRAWLEQVELGVRSQPSGDRLQLEREAILAIEEEVVRIALQALEKFELVADKVDPDARAAHMSYMKRQIHPLVLCSPFIHRSFFKPLGYAGDYEMVDMMVRDPFEGGSVYAKIINRVFLSTPPVEAHRNRLAYLTQLLRDETLRVALQDRPARIYNLGCGPAREIQDLLHHWDLGRMHFTLVDFNQETLEHVARTFASIARPGSAQLQLTRKSVQQIIRDGLRAQNRQARFDVIYCAGLFDYLSDSVCRKLLGIFYELLAPGGLVVATNVNHLNPSRHWMEYVLDWNLIYRSPEELTALVADILPPELVTIRSVGSGVNIVLEARKPDHA